MQHGAAAVIGLDPGIRSALDRVTFHQPIRLDPLLLAIRPAAPPAQLSLGRVVALTRLGPEPTQIRTLRRIRRMIPIRSTRTTCVHD